MNILPDIGDVYLGKDQSLSLCLPIPVSKNRMFMVNCGRMIHSNEVRRFYEDVQMMFFFNKDIKKFVESMLQDKNTIVRVNQIFYTNTHKKDVSGMFVSLYDGLEKITGINDNKYYPDFTDARYTDEEERVLVTMRISKTSFFESKKEGI